MIKLFYAPRIGEDASRSAYSLLARAVKAVYCIALPAIKKTANGKPYFPNKPDIQFSISHSATHVLCALSDRPVGADIESPRVLSERTIRFFSSPSELEAFDPRELWVLKESYIKLTGGTLMLVKSVRFKREGRIITDTGDSCTASLFLINGCCAAVAASDAREIGTVELVYGSDER